LAKLMADMQKMPESVFEKTKAGGVGKFRGDMEAQLEKARGDGTETKVCDKDGCSYVWRSAKYEKLKDSAKATAVDHRGKIDLGVFLGFKRVCTGTRAQMNAKGCVVMTCLKDKCRGSQYRKQNDKGKWEAWGINWKDKEMRKQLRVAKEIYYGVHEDMKLWRHRQALIKRWGYIKAQMLLESEYNIGAQYDPSGTRPITTECVNSCLGGRRGDITSVAHLNRCFAACAPTTAPSGGQRMAERIARLAREKAAARKATPTPTPTVPPPRITPIRSEPVHRPPPAHGEHFTSPGAPTAPPSAPASRRRAPAIKKTPGRPTSSYYAMTGVAA